ncbi:MAG TPA: FkbM family methyltransferase, partial [Xanthobacteraceae bacterium]
NIGLYACIVAKAGVVPRVVAFEPDARNFARLSQNIERNGLAGIVEPHPCAVGSKRGTAYLTPGPPENIGLSKLEDSGPDQQSVPVVALDDEFDVEGSTIAIKIDVEGYELEVLAGAARLFGRNAGYAQIEALGDERAAEITRLMTGHGWRFVDRYGLDLRFERPRPPAPN